MLIKVFGAGVETLTGEAKRDGSAVILSQKFQSNKAYFQIVMLSYNLWRYMIVFAHLNDQEQKTQTHPGQKTQYIIMPLIERFKKQFMPSPVKKLS